MGTEGFYSIDSLVGIHVLVVDDEEEYRDLLSAILRYCGALVTTARSVREAQQLMRVIKCDVLVADISMPDETGYDLIRKIRALKPEDGGVVPAIAVVGDAEDLDQVSAAGFEAHIATPIEPWRLCRLVATLAIGGEHAG